MNNKERRTIRVGTRESILARLQTDMAVNALKKHFPEYTFEITTVKTHGDKVQNKPLFELDGRGVFVKELEEALYANEVDLVVHSLKDLPTEMPAGLTLAAVLERDDPRDVLVSRKRLTFEELPSGSRVATSSRRRTAQLKALRTDLDFVDIRGNIQTRLRKLEEGQCDAMVLAAAGLLRLGHNEQISQYFDIDISTPAVGQAALAIECRKDDEQICSMLLRIDDPKVRVEISAERAFLEKLGGGCSVPIGGIAELKEDDTLQLKGCVASYDGKKILRLQTEVKLGADPQAAINLGIALAEKMLALGAAELLAGFNEVAPSAVSPP